MARILTIVVAIAAVAVAAVFVNSSKNDDDKASTPTTTGEPAKNALTVSMVVSPEKEALLKPLVDQFNAAQTGEKPAFVKLRPENSGDTEAAIAGGRSKPDVWSPASAFWGRLLNLQADKAYVADDNPSIVRTPLVIAVWEPMAKALGWPKKQVSFEQITKLATAPDGWAAAGKPQFGKFKYVHTNPDSSTSGASAVTGSYYAFVGKKEGLTEADVAKAAPKVKELERSIVHYGDSTLFIGDQLCKGGLAYASAVAMEETTVIDFNRKKCRSDKLVALYPTEGSFISDSPYIVLNGDWVTPEKKAAAAAFQKFLAEKLTPDVAGRYGFRPGDLEATPAGLVTAANGADPAQPRRTLTLPTPQVLNTVLETWRRDRKPANVELVLDNSGSMADEDKLQRAKEGLAAFFKQVAPQDEIGLAKFSAAVTPLIPPAPYRENKAKLQQAIDDIIPEDDTSIYDALVYGVDAVKQRADAEHINAVVVLTDGEDTHSTNTRRSALARLEQEGKSESGGVRVFTIAYGRDAHEDELSAFAVASGGKGFKASTDDIEAVYRSISSFF
jgi:Ca-activated chloride channel family protein